MIGYYVHHHGLGHRMRAVEVARRLRTRVVGFGSLPAPVGWPGEWCELPSDLSDSPVDPTANGIAHWVPLDHSGHRQRMGLMAQRLTSDIDTMVVDTSAEVTLLARLFGVRTVVLAMRGDRTDRPHLAAYDAATRIVAPWARLPDGEPGWSEHWMSKTEFVGAISRFDGEPRPELRPQPPSSTRRVLLVWGAGGRDVSEADVQSAQAATPGWTWTVCTPDSPSPDLWAEYAASDVVVTHAGANAVAEVGAARRPAIVVGQQRPFDEQAATVRALRELDCCVALESWPEAPAWPELLRRTVRMGGTGWSRWSPGDSAARAAAAIEQVAEESR